MWPCCTPAARCGAPQHALRVFVSRDTPRLRGSTSLTDLTISRGLFGAFHLPVLHALPQAPALHTLRLEPHPVATVPLARDEYLHIGRSELGALLAADPPRLRTLDVSDFLYNDDGMAAVLEGLEANTHLHELR